MEKWPQPFWASMLALQGTLLAVLALFSYAEKDIKIAVIGIAGSIITGALGYIGGHSAGAAQARNSIGDNAVINQAPVPPSGNPTQQ